MKNNPRIIAFDGEIRLFLGEIIYFLCLIRKETREVLMEFNLFSILFICKSEFFTDYRFIILCIINLILIQTYQ